MIRIQSENQPDGVRRLVIDGQLASDFVAEVENSVKQAMKEHRAIQLFLRDVSHIDQAGCSLLLRLAARGVDLSASGVYSSYIVEEVRRALNECQ
jgi:ABC-type transporter Mla MlaB component